MTIPPLRPILIAEGYSVFASFLLALQLTAEEATLAFTIFTAIVGGIIWAVRVEGRLNTQKAELEGEIKLVRQSHEDFAESVTASLEEIKEMLREKA